MPLPSLFPEDSNGLGLSSWASFVPAPWCLPFRVPRADESSGLPLLLSMFNAEARPATLEEDWEGKWFSIVARVLPNKLAFQGVRLDGWETDDPRSVQVALALPRDGGLTPHVLSLCTGGPGC
jgi:hypothetical protein